MSLEELQSLEGHDDRVWSALLVPLSATFSPPPVGITVRIWAQDAQGK